MNGSLQALLTQKPVAVVHGAYDALTAMLPASAGFTALYVSGPIVGAQELEDLDCSLDFFPERLFAPSTIRRENSIRRLPATVPAAHYDIARSISMS